MYTDPTGNFFGWLIGGVVGAVTSATIALIEGKTGEEFWGAVASGAASGAITGLAADIIVVTGGSAAVVAGTYCIAGAVGAAVGHTVEKSITGEEINILEIADEFLQGAAFGVLNGAMTGPVDSMMKKVISRAGKKALSRGISKIRAARITMRRELLLHNSLDDICSEALSNFNSWLIDTGIKKVVGGE